MIDIVQRDNPVLHAKAKDVASSDIGTAKLAKILANMITALDSQHDGIAIAAPQIGVPLRIFIVSGTLLRQADPEYTGEAGHLVFINPTITRLSREKNVVEEGCLSVRWLYGKVPRSVRATVRALNEKGEKIERGASGLLAQIFQHEVDHLEGILFIDRATDIWEMEEAEVEELKKKK
ncbi:MAG: peptide deformylase [Patescibacteria group bacterium]